MPSQVPPGFTRGSLLFIGPVTSAQAEKQLLQAFWDEAGGFGARLLILPAADDAGEQAAHYTELLRSWECDSVEVLHIRSRHDALQPASLTQIDGATGILILGGNNLRMAATLGGTPVAQAIRRANARGKTVCGMGSCASILCQHMIASDTRDQTTHPFIHRHLIQFAPGLGLINRIALDAAGEAATPLQTRLARLITAVAYNPFLIGIGLEADTGLVVYSDRTMEIFGDNNAVIVDGNGITETNLHDFQRNAPVSMLGVQLHILSDGYIFSLDDRAAKPPPATDIPDEDDRITSAF